MGSSPLLQFQQLTGLRQLAPLTGSSPKSLPAPQQKSLDPVQDAAVVSLSGNAFFGKLEKHIDDYDKGKGNLSREMYGELGDKNSETAQILGQTSPDNALLYASYLTADFSYDSEARFVNGLNNAAKTVSALQNPETSDVESLISKLDVSS